MSQSDDTLTLVLDGDVSLEKLARAISGFRRLVTGLSEDVARDARIDWIVTDLEGGSARASVRGVPRSEDDAPSVRMVITAYERVGSSLQVGEVVPFSPRVQNAAKTLSRLLGPDVRSVRFETSEMDAEITKMVPTVAEGVVVVGKAPVERNVAVRGSVRGRIQSLSSRGGLRFTLYDANDDKAVSCYLEPGSEEIMRDAWGKLAIVEGIVRRNPITGKATTVRHVRDVHVIGDSRPGGYRQAIGASPMVPGQDLPEVAIRKLRDA